MDDLRRIADSVIAGIVLYFIKSAIESGAKPPRPPQHMR